VVVTVLASGDPADYTDTSDLQAHFAQIAGVDPSSVYIEVRAASVYIIATIVVAPSDADSTKASLNDSLGSADDASDALGIAVEQNPTIWMQAVWTASPPSAPADQEPGSDDKNGVNVAAIAVPIVLGFLVLAAVLLACALVQRHKLKGRDVWLMHEVSRLEKKESESALVTSPTGETVSAII